MLDESLASEQLPKEVRVGADANGHSELSWHSYAAGSLVHLVVSL